MNGPPDGDEKKMNTSGAATQAIGGDPRPLKHITLIRKFFLKDRINETLNYKVMKPKKNHMLKKIQKAQFMQVCQLCFKCHLQYT